MDDGIDFGRFEEGRHVNYWDLDPTIRRELRRIYADDEYDWAEPRLRSFGELIGHTVADNADLVDDRGPALEPYDRRGEVQNFVRYPPEQLANEELVYERGIVADAFEAPPDRDEPMPLAHYLGMLYLLCYADGGFGCPVAMTAGAALVLEKFDDGDLDDYYRGLVAREYDDVLEGAMFLTEEQGGSDVGATETTAEYDEEAGCWRLTGEKWFCSNVDAEGTLALARTPDAPEGTDGLSMFLVPHVDPDEHDGALTKGDRRERSAAAGVGPLAPDEVNDQLYRRLKDKLGTIAVPTGEVELDGAKAFLVGEERRGFKQMAEMLNLERLSNAAASCGIMGRALLESRIHAANREAFGSTIDEYPLMREDLVDMTVDHEAATAFTFEAARLFSERERVERAARGDARSGDADPGAADEAYRLMRVLIPIAKLRTGRMAVDAASYAMEIQGGNGYVNDFVTHRLLRDAQVLPIWEGTENILSLDVLRALAREAAHEPLLETIDERLEAVDHPALADAAETTREVSVELSTALGTLAGADDDYAQLSAKRFAHFVFDVFTAALLLEEAQADVDGEGPTGASDGRTALVARRFVDRHLREREARGIASEDRFPIERFDAVVRFAAVEPDALEAPRAAGD
ncbi:acyl-CoA dehydrogenase family protein [Halovivax sp.]|uniref:acyl-CoA dehydrogenase family protein n=1 Tax=Halovivax sp. TaxID=1935978 RepID=UPI0025C50E9D|nr:acyl-CoA dehydrogenase family protein [Halovivax sp.]